MDQEGAGVPYHFRPGTGTPVLAGSALGSCTLFIWTIHYGLAPSALSVPFYLLGLTSTN